MEQKFSPGDTVRVKSAESTPFNIQCPLNDVQQAIRMQFCVEARRPRFYQQPTKTQHIGFSMDNVAWNYSALGQPASISVVGYGASLLDTWQHIPRPILTCSGAHNFLVERGIIPDFHVELDSRLEKLAFLSNPQKQTKYLIASLCHPFVWPKLEAYDVEYFHALNSQHTVDWVTAHDPGSVVMGGGCLVGTMAIHIAGMLGYGRFNAYGLDCSAVNGKWHAGDHHNTPRNSRRALVGNRFFETTRTLITGAWEYYERTAPVADVTLHGDGMLKAIQQDSGWLQQFQQAA